MANPVGGPSGVLTQVFASTFPGTTLPPEWINLAGTRMNDADTLASNVSVHDGACWLQMSDVTQAGATGAYIGTNRDSTPGNGFLLMPGMYVEFDVLFPGNGSQCTGWAAVWSAGGGYPAGGGNFPSHGENDIGEVLGAGVLNYVFHGPNGQYGPNAYPGGYLGGVRHKFGMLRGRFKSDFYLDGAKAGSINTDDDGAGQSLLANIGYASPAYGGINQAGPSGAVQLYSVNVWTVARQGAAGPGASYAGTKSTTTRQGTAGPAVAYAGTAAAISRQGAAGPGTAYAGTAPSTVRQGAAGAPVAYAGTAPATVRQGAAGPAVPYSGTGTVSRQGAAGPGAPYSGDTRQQPYVGIPIFGVGGGPTATPSGFDSAQFDVSTFDS